MLKKQETGRSMIEMLGVLAIIGVLSVGGIAGYTTAMRSHRANEIIHGASMLYMMGMSQNGGEGNGNLEFSTSIGDVPSGANQITYNGEVKNRYIHRLTDNPGALKLMEYLLSEASVSFFNK